MKRKLLKFLLPLSLLFACLGFAACDRGPDGLTAPQNLRVENGVLCWDKVEDADGYTLYINGGEFSTAECSFGIEGFGETEIYNVEIQAYADNGICSAYTDYTYTGMYAVPTEGIEYKKLSSGYRVETLAVDENGSCVIPATYMNLPVTQIAAPDADSEIPKQIKNLYLPKSLIKIESSVFSKLCNLENIMMGEGHEVYASDGNCLIDNTTNTLVVGCINSVIPDYVTKIGVQAYEGRNITDFICPEQIIKIDRGAFNDCKQLKKAVLPETLETPLLTNVFVNCSALTEVNIPEGAQNLSGMFKNCTSLQRIFVPSSATSLDSTFFGCTALKDVVIAEGVEKLSMTFFGCTALKNVEVPASVKRITAAFYGCASLKNITLHEGLEILEAESTLSSVYYGAFGNCAALSTITLPSTLKTIGSFSFNNCVSLKSVSIPDRVTKISFNSFENCKSLESVKLSKNTQGIVGHDAFAGCISLKSFDIPEDVTQLQSKTFNQCTSLMSVVLPKKLSSSYGNFVNCPLKKIFYRGTETDWNENMGKLCNADVVAFDAAIKYYYSEEAPTQEGNYWHYVDGVPAKWA